LPVRSGQDYVVRTFRALVLAGAFVAFALAMLGSWTRINGAGMTCPDWPLCRGSVVPALHGGVVLEWLHRLLAFFETFVVAALVVTGLRLRMAIPAFGPIVLVLAAVFVLQVLVGGATIFLANSPLSVMIHWGTATLLLAVLGWLAVAAFAPDPPVASQPSPSEHGVGPLSAATGWAFVTMCVGAYVSSSGAGLACLSVPGCGPGFFGETIPQALQMTHRFFAASLVAFAVAAAIVLPPSRVRATVALRVALVLLALQIALGVLTVVWSLPPALREAHAVNAIATFLAFVLATALASLGPERGSVKSRSSGGATGTRRMSLNGEVPES
jgi:heme A synthase